MDLKHLIAVFSAFPATFVLVTAHAASAYSEDWDTPDDLAGWDSNTVVSTVVHANTGGNPDGHLQSRGTGHDSFDIGALTELPDATGDFDDTIWMVSVDLSFISGDFDDAWLRFRYLDSTENGWAYSLTDVFSEDWTSYSVMFDPNWTDVEAMANGWYPDSMIIDPGASPSQSWATTMSDVYTTEVRLSGEGDLLAGIDNFNLKPVPVPAAVWLFGSGLIGLIGIARRKKA